MTALVQSRVAAGRLAEAYFGNSTPNTSDAQLQRTLILIFMIVLVKNTEIRSIIDYDNLNVQTSLFDLKVG